MTDVAAPGTSTPSVSLDAPRTKRTAPRRRPRASIAMLTAALLTWAAFLPAMRFSGYNEFGLLLGVPGFALSIALAGLAFVLAVRARSLKAAWACVGGLIVILRLTMPLITSVPPFSWTYKHLGVVDWIQSSGHLARDVDIYNGWPGLFAATAWFSDVTGIAPITLARWWTPALHVLLVATIAAAARWWGLSQWEAVTAAFLLEILNWVSQDYYSPQSAAFLLVIAMIGLAGRSRGRGRDTWMILLLFTGQLVTHQLTPVWTVILFGGLMLLGNLRPRWLPFAMGLMLVAWIAYNWSSVNDFTLFSGDVLGNAQSNVSTKGVFGQFVTSRIVRALSLGVWLSTAVTLVVRWRRGTNVLAPAVVAFSPFLILGGQSYGGEAIFRVFLYALPGCSLVLAPVVLGALRGRLPLRVAGGLLAVGATLAGAQGTYGGWYPNVLTTDQVTIAKELLDRAEFPSYITAVAPTWPERIGARYVEFARHGYEYDQPMVYAAQLVGSTFESEADYKKFSDIVASRGSVPTYIVMSRQMKLYDEYFGILPRGALDNLRLRMLNDPRWTPIYDTSDYSIFLSNPSAWLAPSTGAVVPTPPTSPEG